MKVTPTWALTLSVTLAAALCNRPTGLRSVYRIGDDVQVTVTFSENVTVTGSPQLELAIGSSNKPAEYESTDGSAAVFSYTVAEGDTDSDGIAIGANKLTLNSGSIKDAANNGANLSHNALADQDGHKVDGIRPKIARFFLASSTGGGDGAYSEGEEIIIVAEFTEDFPRGQCQRAATGRIGPSMARKRWPHGIFLSSSMPPRDYGIFGYVVQEGDLDSDGVAISANSIDLNGGFIRDPAGNDAVLTHSAVAASSLPSKWMRSPQRSRPSPSPPTRGMTTPTASAIRSKSPLPSARI